MLSVGKIFALIVYFDFASSEKLLLLRRYNEKDWKENVKSCIDRGFDSCKKVKSHFKEIFSEGYLIAMKFWPT